MNLSDKPVHFFPQLIRKKFPDYHLIDKYNKWCPFRIMYFWLFELYMSMVFLHFIHWVCGEDNELNYGSCEQQTGGTFCLTHLHTIAFKWNYIQDSFNTDSLIFIKDYFLKQQSYFLVMSIKNCNSSVFFSYSFSSVIEK